MSDMSFANSPHAMANGNNLLIAASASLFSIINRLSGMELSLEKEEFLTSLTEEMRAFENRISSRYNTNAMLMTRGVFCSFIDEMVAKSAWGNKNKWGADALSQVFVTDNSAGAKTFFNILEQASQEPTIYLDLLEFIYLCLHLGFEGKTKSPKKANVAEVMSDLYRLINKYRSHVPEPLHAPWGVKEESLPVPPSRQTKKFWLGLGVGLLLAVLATTAIYLVFDYKLQHAVDAVYIRGT